MRCLTASQGGRVRGFGNDDRTLAAFGTENILDEFARFAPPLADQADHDDIGVTGPCQHRHQHRLADARAGKDAQPLAAPHRHESVENTHTQIQSLTQTGAAMGAGRIALQRIGDTAFGQRRSVIERAAETVQHPPQPGRRRPDPGSVGLQKHPRPRAHTFKRPERHHQCRLAAETDNFTLGRAARCLDRRARAQRQAGTRPLGFDKQTVQGRDPPFQHALIQALDTIDQGLHHDGANRLLKVWHKCPSS